MARLANLSFSTRGIRRAATILGAAALIAAGCSEEEPANTSSAPTFAATTTLATTTTTTVATTTTTTVAPATTTTSPPATTTTVPPPSGDPTGASTPIFAGSNSDAWLYLGRWTGSGWERAFDDGGAPIPYDLTSGVNVAISELGQTPVTGTVGESGEACFDEGTGEIPGPVITPNAGVPDIPGFGYRAVALPTTWDTHPREAVPIDETIQAYADAGVAAFADTGVETQAGEVDQTIVSDLDGDGDTEVLVVFGHENVLAEGETGPPGGFSALLLIDADSQAATEVEKSFTPVDVDPAAAPPFDSFRVLDVADLNGDGIAEVLVHSWFVDGASVIVYAYDGATLTEVLTAGCGL